MATLTCHGGVGEIGGNRLLLEDGGGRVLLDFGTSFACQGRYFHEFLKPRKLNGLGDWFRLGLAPPLAGVYRQDYRDRMGLAAEPRGVDAVLVTHAHLDHVGLIPLLRPDVPIHLSAGARVILETLQTTGATTPDYLEFFEDFRLRRGARDGWSKTRRSDDPPIARPSATDDRADAGPFRVEAFDVDHSLPGARGYIVETSAGTVAYTGDFRFHGRDGARSRRFEERLGGVDVLITEGTNMGNEDPSDRTAEMPETVSEEQVRNDIEEALRAEDGFVAVNYPPRDLDRLLSFWEAARATGRRLLLTTKQAWMLDRFRTAGFAVPPLTDQNLGIYLPRRAWGLLDPPEATEATRALAASEYARWERPFLDHPNAAAAADVRNEPSAHLVYVDLFNLTDLVDLDPAGGTYVFSKTEAFNEEMDLDYKLLGRWLDKFSLKFVRAHASGHASRQELEAMIDAARPRKIVPVHTLNAKAFVDRFGDRVARPALGQGVPL